MQVFFIDAWHGLEVVVVNRFLSVVLDVCAPDALFLFSLGALLPGHVASEVGLDGHDLVLSGALLLLEGLYFRPLRVFFLHAAARVAHLFNDQLLFTIQY